jgi:DNA invertase Pin-like site-specific DNA recombinase
MTSKIKATHLERRAVVYMRQSTLKQVFEHRESTARQYALRQRALDLGWSADRIDVIDEDLGQSGSGTEWRTGFKRLAENVAHGLVGGILALEVSRLARSSADWYRLLDLCRLADVVLVDEQTVYTPHDDNDRLLLGLKGTMSEAEQSWMRLRLEGGKMSKARRGELFISPPTGYDWDADNARFCLDPDEHVQRAVRLVFERFRLDGSACAVTRYFVRNGLQLPLRRAGLVREVQWVPPRFSLIITMLRNPAYAGAYVFGRREWRPRLVGGQVRRRHMQPLPVESWKVCIRDRHPAYISWDEYLANVAKLRENITRQAPPEGRGPARRGNILLQGLALCGRCGRRMTPRYCRPSASGYYACTSTGRQTANRIPCWSVPARGIDKAVTDLFLAAVEPEEIKLGLALLREAERQANEVDQQWKLRIERARYEARRAERRYKAVDPDNRVVARTLEREWNDKLSEIDGLERSRGEVQRREVLELSHDDRARILGLANNLRTVWNADTTTHAERKNLLRMLISQVTLTPIDVPQRVTRIQVLWHTGAVSELTVPRPADRARPRTPELVEFVRHLAVDKGYDDEAIAAELNRKWPEPGPWGKWIASAVSRLRWARRITRSPETRRRRQPCPDRRADGLYSVHGLAKLLGATRDIVYYWISMGWLASEPRCGRGSPMWFKLDRATTRQLRNRLLDAKARGYGPGSRSHSKGSRS